VVLFIVRISTNQMKKITHIFAIICFCLAVSHVSNAQFGGGYNNPYGRNRMPDATANFPQKQNEPDAEKIATDDTRWMTKKLKLTEEQIPINYAFKRIDLMEEAKKMVPPFTEEQRAKIRDKYTAMKAGKEKELKEILTPEQFEIYLKKKTDY
jgi:hypothetical protein